MKNGMTVTMPGGPARVRWAAPAAAGCAGGLLDSRRRLSRRRFGRASFRLVVLGGALGVRPSVRAGVTVGAHAGCQCSTGRLWARPARGGPSDPI